MKDRLLKYTTDWLLLPLVGIGVFLALWAVVSSFTFDPKSGKRDLPSPYETWQGSKQYVLDPFAAGGGGEVAGVGTLTLKSMSLVLRGYFIALIVGVPIGFMLGASKVFTKMFDPIFQVLRPVSPLAWLPLGGLIFRSVYRMNREVDVVEWQAVFTIAVCAMWPTVLNTAVGVRAIPQDYLNVAKVLRLGRMKTLFRVMLPAALPYMFTGFRLSLGIAWLVIVAAEMLAGKDGIGKFLWDEFNADGTSTIILSILVIGIVGFLLDRLMTVVERNVNVILSFPSTVAGFFSKLRNRGATSTLEVANAAA